MIVDIAARTARARSRLHHPQAALAIQRWPEPLSLRGARWIGPARFLIPRRRRADIQLDHAQNLDSLSSLSHFTVDTGAFRRILQSSLLQRGDMEEHILGSILRSHEAITLLNVEPLNFALQLRTGAVGLAAIGH